MIFHCHQRQDSITRDAQGMKQVSVCESVCKTLQPCVLLRSSEVSLKFIKGDNGSLECF